MYPMGITLGIQDLLKRSKTIAVVGISDDPERPSHDVASYLRKQGYTVIPINPKLDSWEGIKAYPSLKDIPKDMKVDVVDIFRKGEFVPSIVDEAIAIGAKAIWMQLGVDSEEGRRKVEAAGLQVVTNKCMKIEHSFLFKTDVQKTCQIPRIRGTD
jgi:predicted CoA-binding protein